MKEIIVFLLLFATIFSFSYISDCENIGSGSVAENKYAGYVVVNRERVLLNFMTLEKDSNRIAVYCDDIFYDRYNLGDTLKPKNSN